MTRDALSISQSLSSCFAMLLLGCGAKSGGSNIFMTNISAKRAFLLFVLSLKARKVLVQIN
tara:strand:+ start:200 stop:382 length:183 start_codon:yes stop_codon:yes gene_type:complete